MCAVPNMAVYCCSLMFFPGMLLRYFLNDLGRFYLHLLLLGSLVFIFHTHSIIIIIIVVVVVVVVVKHSHSVVTCRLGSTFRITLGSHVGT